MIRHAIFCKSFRDDFHILGRLISTWSELAHRYPLLISVPLGDRDLLLSQMPTDSGIEVICDEDYVTAGHVHSYGWLQQQVCKLSVFRTGFAESYLVVDSDAYFVAPISDTLFEENGKNKIIYSDLFTGFTESNTKLLRFLQTDNVDAIAKFTNEQNLPFGSMEDFDRKLRDVVSLSALMPRAAPNDRGAWINSLFDVPQGIALQPGQIFHSEYLKEFHDFLVARGFTFSDIIGLAPWEYNWYACWVSATKKASVLRSISPLLHFASDVAIDYAKSVGVTNEQIASRFAIVQMAARHTFVEVYSPGDPDDKPEQTQSGGPFRRCQALLLMPRSPRP